MTTTSDKQNKAALPEADSRRPSGSYLKRIKERLKGTKRDRSREPATGPVLPKASEDNGHEIAAEPGGDQVGSGSGGAQELPSMSVPESESADTISIDLWDEAYQELKGSSEDGDLVEGYEKVLSYEIQRLGLDGSNKTCTFYFVFAYHLQSTGNYEL